MIRFIHAADLHIDSPMKGLESYEGAPVERIRTATRQAFENLVSLAIDEKVDFVLIAGDVFDDNWRDMSTGLWTTNQFRRLEAADIPVYLIRGNHDAASKVTRSLQWPDNVYELSTKAPETIRLPHVPVAVHGQGFDTQAVTTDLAKDYPEPVRDCFNIGILHTGLAGSDPEHDNYAPTSVEVLKLKGYDYWALGHIHKRSVPCEEPYIAWSGNIQGRNVRETGAKGCLLVTVDDNGQPDVEFCPLDVVRWFNLTIELKEDDDVDAMYDLVREKLTELRHTAEDRLCAVRLTLTGACAAHRQLLAVDKQDEAIGQIHDIANALDDIWIESVRLRLRSPVDREALKNSQDLLGELLRSIDHLTSAADSSALSEIADTAFNLSAPMKTALRDAQINEQDPEQLRQWLREAEDMIIGLLSDDSENG